MQMTAQTALCLWQQILHFGAKPGWYLSLDHRGLRPSQTAAQSKKLGELLSPIRTGIKRATRPVGHGIYRPKPADVILSWGLCAAWLSGMNWKPHESLKNGICFKAHPSTIVFQLKTKVNSFLALSMHFLYTWLLTLIPYQMPWKTVFSTIM